MALDKGKTEHAGAKNGGGGMWGKRADVKVASNKRRRTTSKKMIERARAGIPRRTPETFPYKYPRFPK